MKIMRTCAVFVCGAAIAATACAAWNYDQVDCVDLDPLEKVVGAWQPAKNAGPRKVLFFSKCFGYDHKGGRCYGEWTFRRAGELKGTWSFEKTDDVKRLADADYLARFDALVLCNSTGVGEAAAPGLTAALSAYVKGGKGIALVHAALDAFKDADELLDLFGGYFRGHPWHGDGTWRFLNEQPGDPINAPFKALPASFEKTDEIYEFPAFFSRKRCRVLVSLDLADPVTKEAESWWAKRFGPGSIRADHDYAVSWTKDVGKGRIFYTSFGHDRNAFLDPQRLHHMLFGVQYALGDLTPSAAPEGPSVAACRDDWANGPCRDGMDRLAKSLKGETLDFAFFGDSITMGWTYPAAHKYSGGKEIWEREFGKLKTANFGVSGDRCEHVLWRATTGGQADGWKAKTIFLMIGVNHAWASRGGKTVQDSAESVADGIRACVDALRAKHPESRIALFSVLPTSSQERNAWIARINDLAKSAADGKTVRWLDAWPLFIGEGNVAKKGLLRDGLHPNPAGYEVLAAEMKKELSAY